MTDKPDYPPDTKEEFVNLDVADSSGLRDVYPWDTARFGGSREKLRQVMMDIHTAGYHVSRIRKKPDEKVIKALGLVRAMLYELMMKAKASDQMPWLVLKCNNPKMMQAIALYFPATFVLSVRNKKPMNCYSCSTQYLKDLFHQNIEVDSFDANPNQAHIQRMRGAGLLVWENVVDQVSNVIKDTGRYCDILRYRMKSQLPTLILAPFEGKYVKDATEEAIYNKVASCLGEQFRQLLELEADELLLMVKKDSESKGRAAEV